MTALDEATRGIVTDALALQYAGPLPFGEDDAQLLTGLALAWEVAGSPVRARRLRVLARIFINSLAGLGPLSFNICDTGDVLAAARLCPALEGDARRRAWALATRMERALAVRPVADVVQDVLRGVGYSVTPQGVAALAYPAETDLDDLEG